MSERTTILICDDEDLIRWSLREHLEGEGYRVVEADNGAEALGKVGTERPDLVLSDLKMPQMDGIELLRRIRAQGSAPPVIVLTAYGSLQVADELLALGAASCLAKPFDLEAVSAAVAQVLRAE